MADDIFELDWSQAPAGWDWAAQDEDGRWFWYGVQPQPSIGGGVWRAPSRAMSPAGRLGEAMAALSASSVVA